METANAAAVLAKTRTDGHLVNLADWSPTIAEYLASQHGIKLTDAHWEIINLMRTYYQTYNISPIRKLLLKEIRENFGDTKATDAYLNSLFPGDVMIAGIPVPLSDAEAKSLASSAAQGSGVAKANQVRDLNVGDRVVKIYAKGNLVNPEDWSTDIAKVLAEREGITLSDAHWDVINFLRDFYRDYGIAPMVKLLVKHIRHKLGPDIGNNEYLYQLFPKGPARQGSRIAGLPEPQGCIDP